MNKEKNWIGLEDMPDLLEKAENDAKAKIDNGQTWGIWKFVRKPVPMLQISEPRLFRVPLAEIATTAALGEWLWHLQEKPWIKAEDMGNLVRALADLETAGYHSVEGSDL